MCNVGIVPSKRKIEGFDWLIDAESMAILVSKRKRSKHIYLIKRFSHG